MNLSISSNFLDLLSCFVAGKRENKYYLDLYAAARQQLEQFGVTAVSGGEHCTYMDKRFFSYRRDGVTGRMAKLIWMQNN